MATSSGDDVFTANVHGYRERPLLMPWNRKARHLHGISVRNLSIAEPHRTRGKTITDDDVPSAFKSPTKLLAQNEARSLHHSHSFTGLKSHTNEHISPARKTNTDLKEQSLRGDGSRPAKLRRRSTLHWSGASPSARQKRLEDVAELRLADAWFSLHVEGQTDPVYISEEIENAMNPDFRAFDLNTLGPSVSRNDHLLLKLWAKSSIGGSYALLLELDLSLRSLQFMGKSLENFHHPLPANCVLFHLTDGIYTSFTDLAANEHPIDLFRSGGKEPLAGEQCTSSFDALMRLSNLDECIQDALATREKIENRINALIAEHRDVVQISGQVAQGMEGVHRWQRATLTERKQLRSEEKRRDELIKSLEARRAAMRAARDSQSRISKALNSSGDAVGRRRTKEKKIEGSSIGQIRRICEDLLKIFPIEAIPKKALHFTIRGLPLPNSKFDDMGDKDLIAAALGYTAQVVVLLSRYLSVPLPYPIWHLASTSLIEDPISVALSQRVYPLYPINVTYRFEYGVFLLNKNIEILMDHQGLRLLDIRHTLPNLKYLTYVLTAGTGELPARKAGGIRGLLPALSRRSSEDSMVNGIARSNRKGSDGSIAPMSGKLRENEENRAYSPGGSPRPGPTFRSSALRQTS